jgi:hypothetical protein
MGGPERTEQRCHRISGQRRQGGDIQHAGQQANDIRHGSTQGRHVTQHLPSGRDECVPGARQHGSPSQPVEQLDT